MRNNNTKKKKNNLYEGYSVLERGAALSFAANTAGVALDMMLRQDMLLPREIV